MTTDERLVEQMKADAQADGKMDFEQRARAMRLAESHNIDDDTAHELVYLRDRKTELERQLAAAPSVKSHIWHSHTRSSVQSTSPFPDAIPTTTARTDGELPSASVQSTAQQRIAEKIVDLCCEDDDGQAWTRRQLVDKAITIVSAELAATSIEEGWRDMDSAPKDGTRVLLGWPNGVAIGFFGPKYSSGGVNFGDAWGNGTTWDSYLTDAVGWQPLPPLPAPPEAISEQE
jgi:hypothetical protein